MQTVISKCGYMCSSCPWGIWIRRNQTEEEWDSYAEEVKRYVGFSPTKNPCHGCQTPTDKLSKEVGAHNVLRTCSARKCAFHNEIRNCAYCARFPCDKIEVLNAQKSREDANKRLGFEISDEKYEQYVRIFQGKKNLEEIRATLKPEEIIEPKQIDIKPPKIVPFPDVEGEAKFKKLHDALSKIISSSFGIKNSDVVAGHEMIKDRREILLRILWIYPSLLYSQIPFDQSGT